MQKVKSFPPLPQTFRRHWLPLKPWTRSTLGKKLRWCLMGWPRAEKRWFTWKAKQRGAVEFRKIRNSDQRWLEDPSYPKNHPLFCVSPPEVEQGFETKNLKGQHVPGSLDNWGISMQLTFEFSMHTYYDSLKCYSDIFFLLNIIFLGTQQFWCHL